MYVGVYVDRQGWVFYDGAPDTVTVEDIYPHGYDSGCINIVFGHAAENALDHALDNELDFPIYTWGEEEKA